MATRDVTDATRLLAAIFERWREVGLDNISKIEAGRLAGFKGDSTYRNIEAGREVSLSSYRQAARKLGLPGGEDRVTAIFNGEPDPLPFERIHAAEPVEMLERLTEAAPRLVTPHLVDPYRQELTAGQLAGAARLAELVRRLESLLIDAVDRTEHLESELAAQRSELESLAAQVAAQARSTEKSIVQPRPRRRSNG